MIKTIMKEIIVILLLLLAIVLALGVLFYEYIPTNKIVPNVPTYSTSETIKEELSEQVTEDEPVLVTYEVTSSDLKNYEKTNQYKKGKSNPFSTYENVITNDEPASGSDSSVSSTNTDVQTSNTKGSSTFYGNTGTK